MHTPFMITERYKLNGRVTLEKAKWLKLHQEWSLEKLKRKENLAGYNRFLKVSMVKKQNVLLRTQLNKFSGVHFQKMWDWITGSNPDLHLRRVFIFRWTKDLSIWLERRSTHRPSSVFKDCAGFIALVTQAAGGFYGWMHLPFIQDNLVFMGVRPWACEQIICLISLVVRTWDMARMHAVSRNNLSAAAKGAACSS